MARQIFRFLMGSLLAAGIVSCKCVKQSNANTTVMKQYFDSKIVSGNYGIYLRDLSGCLLEDYKASQPFYSASTIKVVQLVHAALAIQSGQVTLQTPVTKFVDKTESCADTHEGHLGKTLTMDSVLKEMMRKSDNQSSNALQEFFGNGNAAVGREKINATAHNLLQMSNNTALNHKFTCGGGPANNPSNSLTLADIGKLYEKLAKGLLDINTTAMVDDIMLDLDDLTAVINEEGSSLGISPAILDNYKSQVKSRRKHGNYNAASYQSIGGWVSLPNKTGTPTQYVFGLFLQDGERLNEKVFIQEAAAELLRPAVRKSLATFK